MRPPVLQLFTDFGWSGPYVGQVKVHFARSAPGVAIVDLMHDAPAHNAKASAYLLAALVAEMPPAAVTVCVVDPGVGGERLPVALQADGRWFVGPHNGLLELVRRRAERAELFQIGWQPEALSHSFHGRDLFAPAAARLATGQRAELRLAPLSVAQEGAWQCWPDDLAEILYVDGFGNAMTGLRADRVGMVLNLPRHNTFADVPVGRGFCYANSLGLLEIAVNQGRAAEKYGLKVGMRV